MSAATSSVSSQSTATSNDCPAARGNENAQNDATTLRCDPSAAGATPWLARRVSTTMQPTVATVATAMVTPQITTTLPAPPPAPSATAASTGSAHARAILSITTSTVIVPKPRLPWTSTV